MGRPQRRNKRWRGVLMVRRERGMVRGEGRMLRRMREIVRREGGIVRGEEGGVVTLHKS